MLEEYFALAAGTLIVASRLAPIFALSPLLNSFRVAGSIRLLVVLALALSLAPVVSTQFLETTSLAGVAPGCASEALAGACLAMGIHATFAAFSIAGKLIDVQSGLAMASVIDPVTKVSGGALSQIFTAAAVALFFFGDLHLDLLRATAASYEWLPIGSLSQTSSLAALASATSKMFVAGVGLAAPVMLALLIIDVAVALTSRSMPQLNVLVLGTPLKAMAAIGILSITCRQWPQSSYGPLRLFESFFAR